MARLKAISKKALVAAVALVAVGVMPAHAESLKDWQYDEQTRSLTFTLPDSVVPLVSVVAPDQLVLELPNTQIGAVMGQSIRDGLVESIVLEQATPETVWVVMDFAAGTVLAASQNAIPVAETPSGDQQWQVRPALVAASRRAASQSIASADTSSGSAASVLRSPAPAIAQSPDFSDLPVLEPAMPIDEPVSVPPLNTLPIPTNEVATPSVVVPSLEEPTARTPQPSAPSADAASGVPEENFPVFEVEVIPAEPPVAIEVAPIEPVETATNGSDLPTAAASQAPFEPPFLGDLDGDSQSVPVPQVPAEPPVATQPAPDDRIASGRESVEPRAVEPAAEPVPVQSSNVSRWPEPIPFGQPLPR